MSETGMVSAAVVVFVEMTKIATAKTIDRHENSVRLFVCIFPLLWIACFGISVVRPGRRKKTSWQPACLRDFADCTRPGGGIESRTQFNINTSSCTRRIFHYIALACFDYFSSNRS
jgi:hypothetical protein